MVFKRRDKLTLRGRVRQLLPRRGWRRGIEYVGHRVRRIPDTPHRIALGFSCGVMMSFTPFFGLHLFGSMGLAWLLRGNVLASVIGQFVGNPLTLPFISWISMSLGRAILGGGFLGRDFERIDMALGLAARGVWRTFLSLFGIGESEWNNVTVIWSDVILPYFVGGLLPGLVCSLLFYFLVRAIVGAYQARRRARRLGQPHRRHAERDAAGDGAG
ncbi:DUF2062 domain-containing protein [Amaricoccus sp.]|uniref:DUF2062 domain-containing protein n=1 Tax=Amaricoccus sp. TaxID=1872485 RepID=UPI00262571C7|nr:DUF2062 domain-containing protein [Amaricoccus sp.]HRO10142.1 DUF2062 domain-containing protein [Amaricoccus sp.]